MDLQEQYTRRLGKIEERIRQILPPEASSAWIQKITGDSGEEISSWTADMITAPARELLGRGGKRWRPVLMLVTCEMCGGGESALALTPLVELPHNGTLIVDDIEDGADTRRGGPAVHLLYGHDVSINTGNLLYFLPTMLIEESGLSAAVRAALFTEYCAAMRRLHVGQGLDISWHNDPDALPDERLYLRMCRYKTGSLSRFAARAGILAAGNASGTDALTNDASGIGERGEILSRCCEEAGVAFQILDDVRNLTTGNPGKMRGDDIVEGKKSLPFLYAAEDGEARRILSECISGARDASGDARRRHIERAIATMQETGAIERAKDAAESIMEGHIRRIEEHFPPSEARHVLIYMLTGFVAVVRKGVKPEKKE